MNQGRWLTTFLCDGDGNRVKGTVNGTTTAYIGAHFEWTGSTSTMKKYYYSGGSRIAMRVGSSTRYYLLGDHPSVGSGQAWGEWQLSVAAQPAVAA